MKRDVRHAFWALNGYMTQMQRNGSPDSVHEVRLIINNFAGVICQWSLKWRIESGTNQVGIMISSFRCWWCEITSLSVQLGRRAVLRLAATFSKPVPRIQRRRGQQHLKSWANSNKLSGISSRSSGGTRLPVWQLSGLSQACPLWRHQARPLRRHHDRPRWGLG